ncbi:MAG TPA: transcription initiation factor IIB [Candidatus Bathyarchaeota archaeon]|nr:transcription initiation factor IIB [Candidatus Bathyarchaeota archaeon]
MTSKLNSLSAERCSECGSSLLLRDTENAEIVCGNCGFVLTTHLTDRGPEWRAFTPEERKQKVRVGAPQTYMLHDKGLSTKIDWRDISGFSPEKRAQLHRIRQWQQRSRVSSSIEKNLAVALSEISRISDALNLPKNIVESSAITYRKAVNEGLIRGRSIKGIATAATYLACRQSKLVRTVAELSKVSDIPEKEIASNYRFLVRKLKIFVPPVRANQHITKLSNQLGLNGRTEGIAHKILIGAKKQKLTAGRGAKGIAAAACYIASIISGDYRTQREFAEAADLTEVTIRNRYREMMKRLKIVVSF